MEDDYGAEDEEEVEEKEALLVEECLFFGFHDLNSVINLYKD